MATSSYANLFGTTGGGQQGSKAGISTLFGQQAVPAGETEDERQRKAQQAQQTAPAKTFAQMQAAGQARPAPPPTTMAAGQHQMLGQLQQQLSRQLPPTEAASTGMGDMIPMPAPAPYAPPAPKERAPMAPPAAPTSASLAAQLQQQLTQLMQTGGYTDREFEQLRRAQTANLQAEYGAEQQRLNEELARRGLSASSIGAGRMGDLAGQQARAMATLQSNLLQQQAELRQKARETGLATMSDLTKTLAVNEQAAAETRLKEQLGMSEIAGVLYKRDANGNLVPATDAENQQIKTLAAQEVARRLGIAEAEVTGMFGGKETLAAQTQRRNLAIQLAQALAGSDDPEVLKSVMPYIYQAFGITPPPPTPVPTPAPTPTPTPTPAPVKPVTSTVPETPPAPGTPIPGLPGTKPGIPVPTVPTVPPIEPKGPQKPTLPGTAPTPVPTPAPIPAPTPTPVKPPVPVPAPVPAQPQAAPLKPILTGGVVPNTPMAIPAPEAPPPVIYELPPELMPTPAPTPAPVSLKPMFTPVPELMPEPMPVLRYQPTEPLPTPMSMPEPMPEPRTDILTTLTDMLPMAAPAPAPIAEPMAAPAIVPAIAPAPVPAISPEVLDELYRLLGYGVPLSPTYESPEMY